MVATLQYKTKQRKELLAYLRSVSGSHVTVHDISNYFQQKGEPIGTATIYRQLDRMVAEGLVNKYILDQVNGACFEYVDKTEHCQQPTCFHCKCEHCGQLIHLKCEELEQIQEHLFSQHCFTLDPLRTVFYGLCEQCRKTLGK